jgi:hypothetical protein
MTKKILTAQEEGKQCQQWRIRLNRCEKRIGAPAPLAAKRYEQGMAAIASQVLS